MFPRSHKVFRNGAFMLVLSAFFLLIWVLVRKPEDFENCWAQETANCGLDENTPLIPLPTEEPPQHSRPLLLLEGHYNDHLTPRMLCAVESAALTHPNTTVYVMMTSQYLRETPITKSVMSKYRNIRFAQLNTSRLFADSPLQSWFALERWKMSLWPKSHFNDALRWLMIWKYGGIYLDLDVVVLKNLLQEGNFAGLESDKWVGAGALGFTMKHPFVEECLRTMNLTFDGKVWGANGPELLTNVLIEWCGMELPSGNLPKCPDMKILSTKAFYSIPWWEWWRYTYEDEELSEALLGDPEVLALHVWNLHTQNKPVVLYESNPYAMAAINFCPIVVYEVGYQF